MGKNYRSTPEIVGVANAIQQKMTDTIPITMTSIKGGQGTVRRIGGSNPRDLAQGISMQIAKDNVLRKDGIKFKDNAILVRAKSQMDDIEAELVRRRIPYIIKGGTSLLQSEECRDMLSYLKVISNPKDYQSFSRAVAVPPRGVGEKTLEKIREFATKGFDDDLILAGEKYNHEKLSLFIQFLKSMTTLQSDPLRVYTEVLKYTKYESRVKDIHGKKRPDLVERKLSNLERMGDIITGMMEASATCSLSDVVFQMAMSEKVSSEDPDGKVTIATIHAVKGLEYQRVFLMGLYEGSLPHRWSLGTEREISEERRLFYVGCTRAISQLVFGIPSTVQMGPNYISVTPSRFLSEINAI